MRKLIAIILITVIVAAPVSRYTDYVHCMAMVAINLQKNCGCDSSLISMVSNIDNNNPIQSASISHSVQSFSDWIYNAANNLLPQANTLLVKKNPFLITQYTKGFLFINPKPPSILS